MCFLFSKTYICCIVDNRVSYFLNSFPRKFHKPQGKLGWKDFFFDFLKRLKAGMLKLWRRHETAASLRKLNKRGSSFSLFYAIFRHISYCFFRLGAIRQLFEQYAFSLTDIYTKKKNTSRNTLTRRSQLEVIF